MKTKLPLLLLTLLAFTGPLVVKSQCNASFTVSTGGCTSKFFTDNSTVDFGSVLKWDWDFGDGSILSAETPFSVSHSFPAAGTYTVVLIITTSGGCTDTAMQQLTIRSAPEAEFSFSMIPTCAPPYGVQFVNTSTAGSSPISLNTWKFGDINGTTSNDPNPFKNYLTPGAYTVQLIVRNQDGCRDTAIHTITTYSKPKINFSYSSDATIPKKINFTDLSTSSIADPIAYSYWDFGNGESSLLNNPSHIFSNYGIHTIKHYVKTSIDCTSDTSIINVYVDSLVNAANDSVQSNFGTEFWTGFGYQEKMSRKAGDAAEAQASVYIAAGENPSTVVVSLPGIPGAAGFPRILHIPANTIMEVTGFPTGDPANAYNPSGMPDARLYFTGVTNRGVHISSSNPVAAWEHIYASGNTAGATLLLPSHIWSNAYTVQTIGGKSNNANPNSFFFVVAKDDSTLIHFTPSNDILDSSTATLFTQNSLPANILYHAGVTYAVMLNKGQVFNAMGAIPASLATAVDLSGTKVISKDPTKKIAVFAGNGRVLINTAACSNTAGSDNLIQQMFPKVAWGTKYLTTPTKTMEYCIYRIAVDDITTVVKVNSVTLSPASLVNNSFYQVEGNKPNLIEADKKIMVSQYVVTPGCPNNGLGNNGQGDPEMIILSPVTQTTNNAVIYSPGFKTASAGGNYINVIIRQEGVAGFKLDGTNMADTGLNSFILSPNVHGPGNIVSMADAFKPHPGDPAYYYARLRVTGSAVHRLSADHPFNVIAYGMNDGESYGFNGGFRYDFVHKVYTFTGSGNWSNPANWQDNIIPPPILPTGSEIIIKGDCVLDISQAIEEGATFTVLTAAKLLITGNLEIH